MKLNQKTLIDTLSTLMDYYEDDYEVIESYFGIVLNRMMSANKDINPTIVDIINYLNFYLIPKSRKDITKELKSLIKTFDIKLEDVCLAIVECKNCLFVDFNETEILDGTTGCISEERTRELMSYQIIIQDLVFMLQLFKTRKVGRINAIRIDDLSNDRVQHLSKSKYIDYYKETVCKTDKDYYLIQAGIAKFKMSLNDLKYGINSIISFVVDEVLTHYYLERLLPENYEFYDLRVNTLDNFVIKLIMERIEESNVSSCPAFIELLRKREFLIPHSGVNISGKRLSIQLDVGEFKFAENIDLYERQYNGHNFLIVLDNSTESCFVTIINLHTGTLVNTNPDLYGVLNRLYYFYELYDKKPVGGKYDPWLYYALQILQIDAGVKTIKGTLSDDFENYNVEAPYYWRYKGRYKSSSQQSNRTKIINNNKTTYVSAFTRRLPQGHKRSDEAVRLSKIYCLKLKDNETIVRPFERKLS